MRQADYVGVMRAKREAVWSELETLRSEQKRLADRVALKEVQLRNLDELLSMESIGDIADDDEVATRGSAGFLDTAADVIREAKAPVHYQELLKQVNGKGVNVPGRDPAANLIAHIGRDQRFVRTGRGTYGLQGIHQSTSPTRRVVRTKRPRIRSKVARK